MNNRTEPAHKLVPNCSVQLQIGPAGVAWEQYPHLLAIPYFARALGAARTGDQAAAEEAIAKLAELQEKAAALPGAYDWGIQVEIQKLGAQGWLAYEQGDQEAALALMAEAARKEASTSANRAALAHAKEYVG